MRRNKLESAKIKVNTPLTNNRNKSLIRKNHHLRILSYFDQWLTRHQGRVEIIDNITWLLKKDTWQIEVVRIDEYYGITRSRLVTVVDKNHKKMIERST